MCNPARPGRRVEPVHLSSPSEVEIVLSWIHRLDVVEG